MNDKKFIGKIKFAEPFYVFCGLIVLFIYFSTLAYLSKGSHGGADCYAHYKIAHYAFKYPRLFLDLWGKPIFTLFSSPFAQFGFTGIKIFNIICALVSGWFCYRICKKLNLNDSPLVIILLCFAPMYFVVSISVLTEIAFSLVLILAIYLFLEKKYVWSAIIISLLPFARQEGIVVFPLFLLMLLIRKQYKAIPFLTFGFLIFSSIGYFYYNDFLWVIHQNPYNGDVDIYGHGELMHFVSSYKEILGIPLSILFLIGIIQLIYKCITFRKGHPFLLEEIVLIFGSAAIYIAGHSYVWWKGLHGSLGITRVMAGVIPAIAIVCLEGYNLLRNLFSFNKIARYALTIFILVIVIYTPIEAKLAPIPIGEDQEVMEETSEWLEQTPYSNNLTYYFDPFFSYALHKDDIRCILVLYGNLDSRIV
jgi:Gpi18-like mannosyltransferase